MEDSKLKNWAILKIGIIITSKNYHCIRCFYIGDENGVNYLEMEFYPCIRHVNLPEEYKRLFRLERNKGHGLRNNPRLRPIACTLAPEKMKMFVECSNIELILYNGEYRSVSEKIYINMSEVIPVKFLNICQNLSD